MWSPPIAVPAEALPKRILASLAKAGRAPTRAAIVRVTGASRAMPEGAHAGPVSVAWLEAARSLECLATALDAVVGDRERTQTALDVAEATQTHGVAGQTHVAIDLARGTL